MLWGAVGLVLIVALLSVGSLKRWINSQRKRVAKQLEYIDRYYRYATSFLQMSHSTDHGALRATIVGVGECMTKGDFLIQSLLSARVSDGSNNGGNGRKGELHAQYEALSDEAKTALAKALAAALLVSALNSTFFARKRLNLLDLLLSSSESNATAAEGPRLANPEQIVYRFARSSTMERECVEAA